MEHNLKIRSQPSLHGSVLKKPGAAGDEVPLKKSKLQPKEQTQSIDINSSFEKKIGKIGAKIDQNECVIDENDDKIEPFLSEDYLSSLRPVILSPNEKLGSKKIPLVSISSHLEFVPKWTYNYTVFTSHLILINHSKSYLTYEIVTNDRFLTVHQPYGFIAPRKCLKILLNSNTSRKVSLDLLKCIPLKISILPASITSLAEEVNYKIEELWHVATEEDFSALFTQFRHLEKYGLMKVYKMQENRPMAILTKASQLLNEMEYHFEKELNLRLISTKLFRLCCLTFGQHVDEILDESLISPKGKQMEKFSPRKKVQKLFSFFIAVLFLYILCFVWPYSEKMVPPMSSLDYLKKFTSPSSFFGFFSSARLLDIFKRK